MTHTKVIALALIGTAVVGLTGCEYRFNETWRCVQRSSGTVCERIDQRRQKMMEAPSAFNASLLEADVGDSVLGGILTSSSTGVLTIFRNQQFVASTPVAFQRIGTSFRPSNPAALNTWVRANSLVGDDLAFSFNGIQVSALAGANMFAVTYRYAGVPVGGGAYAWNNSIGGTPPQEMQ